MEKADYLWFNGNLVAWDDARVHVWAHALHYGTSVFEGIRGYHKDDDILVFRLEEHLKRLEDSAKMYHMKTPYTLDDLFSASVRVVQENKFKTGIYIRPIHFRDYGVFGLNPLKSPVSTAIIAMPLGKYLNTEKPQHVTVSSWRKLSQSAQPLKAKAGGNYVNSILAKQEAVLNGFDEALLLDEHGYVCEGSAENFFMVKDQTIITPPLSAPILAGITRDSIVTLAKEKGFDVLERTIARSEVYIADEAFFTGTAGEVAGIGFVDRMQIGSGNIGPITQQLQASYFETVLGNNDAHQKWITRIPS
ncbi:branched chain amino acid aminotransferase [archaeon CG10_big_fil_rev_8_21_14_0_10_43_11]|nr:MAG: branched chain amino acid aminotransferase [archaeon CG10_big_fil_rev_8_21_14_0_10_43_11]